MTAKEQAHRIIEKFHQEMYHDLGAGASHYVNKAPRCALIAVKEIIDAITLFHNGPEWGLVETTGWQYWQSVKSEIENYKP